MLLLVLFTKAQTLQHDLNDTTFYVIVNPDYSVINNMLAKCHCLNMASAEILYISPGYQDIQPNSSFQPFIVIRLTCVKDDEYVIHLQKVINSLGGIVANAKPLQ